MKTDSVSRVEQWAKKQWGEAVLGDARRTARAVKLGAALARQPDSSLPKETGSWADLKGAYRLLNEPDVTYEALARPHWEATREMASWPNQGVLLFVQDQTVFSFNHHPATVGLGNIGDHRQNVFGQAKQGFLMHDCLAVQPEHPSGVLGLAHATVWTRQHALRQENDQDRLKRQYRGETEAALWAQTLLAIGQAPSPESGTTWVSVGDRGSDIFDYVQTARGLGWHVLLRVNQNRLVALSDGRSTHLKETAEQLTNSTSFDLDLRARPNQPARTAHCLVAYSRLSLLPPRHALKKGHPFRDLIGGTLIRVVEQHPAEGVQPIKWLLFTTLPVKSPGQALEIVRWYTLRWLIEEYHKCLKTGCAMEERQLQTAAGLETLLGFLSIVAVLLLQLRQQSRTNPNQPAHDQIPGELVRLVAAHLNRPASTLTTLQFWRGTAGLGGFLGRKKDGLPGWQTVWRGWLLRLLDMAYGAELLTRGEKCG